MSVRYVIDLQGAMGVETNMKSPARDDDRQTGHQE
jgi:hypothetical protein